MVKKLLSLYCNFIVKLKLEHNDPKVGMKIFSNQNPKSN